MIRYNIMELIFLIQAMFFALVLLIFASGLYHTSTLSVEEWIIFSILIYNDVMVIRILYIYAAIQETSDTQIQ